MRTFTLVMCIMFLLGTVASARVIGKGKYPRQTERGTDMVSFWINLSLFIWAFIALGK